jgi:hypothetical protein
MFPQRALLRRMARPQCIGFRAFIIDSKKALHAF